jgi:Lon protease-like protein
MSDLLPLFPLPTVVLFPRVFLPLHVFEPRYREMVADALSGDRMIGMALLRGGWEDDYEGRPPVYAIGCSGLITHCDRLPDGRYNIVLRGLDRFRIVAEDHSRAYRRARTIALPEAAPGDDDRDTLRTLRDRIEALVSPSSSGGSLEIGGTTSLADEDLVNALAQYLDLEPIEKQALLEQAGVVDRARALLELLDMKMLLGGRSSGPHTH